MAQEKLRPDGIQNTPEFSVPSPEETVVGLETHEATGEIISPATQERRPEIDSRVETIAQQPVSKLEQVGVGQTQHHVSPRPIHLETALQHSLRDEDVSGAADLHDTLFGGA